MDSSGTLDLSMKKPSSAADRDEQQEPMDFSKKTLDSQGGCQGLTGLLRASPLVTSSQSPPPLHHLPLEMPVLGETPVLGNSPTATPLDGAAVKEMDDELNTPSSPLSQQDDSDSMSDSEDSLTPASPVLGNAALHSPSEPTNGISSPDMPGDEAR